MAEIVLDFFFPHPVARVWRALTDSALLATWFMENDLVARAGHRFRLRPVDLAGMDGLIRADVVRSVEPHVLDMVWSAQDLHLGVTWRIQPVPGGSVLEVLQNGFLGLGGAFVSKALVMLSVFASGAGMRFLLLSLTSRDRDAREDSCRLCHGHPALTQWPRPK